MPARKRTSAHWVPACVTLAMSLAIADHTAAQITPGAEDRDETFTVFRVHDIGPPESKPEQSSSCGTRPDCQLCAVGCCRQVRAPNMIGDFFGGFAAGARGSLALDRLVVVANDLDVPAVLPPGGSVLTITEPGPVGIFSSSVLNVQQLQQLLRSGAPVPPPTLVGNVADNATMTTTMTISQIQALLASTPEAYDIVSLVAPPASYTSAVDAQFQLAHGAGGTTTFDASGSGAMLQAGVDTLTGGEDFDAFYYYSYGAALNVPTPSAGVGAAGRVKVASGNSPLPRDRVYFHYGLFSDVPSAANTDVDRFLPGFEKTFAGGMFSVEARFPFAATSESTLDTGGLSGHSVEFGNIAIYTKALLYASQRLGLSAGLGVTIPTADDISVVMANTPVLRVSSESVHLQPFLAALYTPSDCFFAQGFLQLDIDANGNSALVNPGSGLAPAGVLQDATYLFADLGVGYWAYRCDTSCLTGVAPMVEVHYNASLQGADSITSGALRVGNFGDSVDTVNLTLGATLEFGANTNLAVGYVAPVSGNTDRQFDGGFRVLFDHYPCGGIR